MRSKDSGSGIPMSDLYRCRRLTNGTDDFYFDLCTRSVILLSSPPTAVTDAAIASTLSPSIQVMVIFAHLCPTAVHTVTQAGIFLSFTFVSAAAFAHSTGKSVDLGSCNATASTTDETLSIRDGGLHIIVPDGTIATTVMVLTPATADPLPWL